MEPLPTIITLNEQQSRQVGACLTEKDKLNEALGETNAKIDELEEALDTQKDRRKGLQQEIKLLTEDIEQILRGNHIERFDFESRAATTPDAPPAPPQTGIEAFDAMNLTDWTAKIPGPVLAALKRAKFTTGRDVRLWVTAQNGRAIKGINRLQKASLEAEIEAWIKAWTKEHAAAGQALVDAGLEEIKQRGKPPTEIEAAQAALEAAINKRLDLVEAPHTVVNQRRLIETLRTSEEPTPEAASPEVLAKWTTRVEGLGKRDVTAILAAGEPTEPDAQDKQPPRNKP